ncbi:NAD-dependent epimerase/dehydratase family protein [Kitasatospora sp. NPDC101155]|uniref:NAD-dependent epimerase/dehydratase family protein n=1 Tax=Kitasatospora sp. NPDC101155 TaxID=3364097 RepID=UPI00381DBDEC
MTRNSWTQEGRSCRLSSPWEVFTMQQPRHVAVTGSAGLVGSAIVRRLRGAGRPVVGVDRLPSADTSVVAATHRPAPASDSRASAAEEREVAGPTSLSSCSTGWRWGSKWAAGCGGFGGDRR